MCLGQNQGKGAYYVAYVAKVYNADFLGIFRNTEWESSPEPPTPAVIRTSKFPWPIAWHNWENFK